jgi:hypothetical protein
MDSWVKAGVVGTFLCVVLGLWPLLNGESAVAHPLMTAIAYGSPVVAGALLFASVWIAFRRPRRPHPDRPIQPPIPGYSQFTLFSIALGAYKNVDFGSGHHPDRIRIELLEITRKPMPGAFGEEDADADHRCVRLGLDGFIPFTGRGAIEVPSGQRLFEVILFEFESSGMMTPSIAFHFHRRQEGFSFIAIVVEHINVETKTAELGIYGTDLWAEPSSMIRVNS